MVADQLATEGRGRTAELTSYRPHALLMTKHDLHHGALFKCQVDVGLGQAADSPKECVSLGL